MEGLTGIYPADWIAATLKVALIEIWKTKFNPACRRHMGTEADRQARLKEALILQMEMQKRLHDQLEVCHLLKLIVFSRGRQ